MLLSKYYEVDEIKENEMGEAYGMHRRKGMHGGLSEEGRITLET